MTFEYITDKISEHRSDRNFNLLGLGVTGGLSLAGALSGVGLPAVLTGVAAVYFCGRATVHHRKLSKWVVAQSLVEDNANPEHIKQALADAVGPTKPLKPYKSDLPDLSAPSPRPPRKAVAPSEQETTAHPSPHAPKLK